MVGTQKHRTLTWGQFQCVTNLNSQDLLRFTSRSAPHEIKFCHGHGGPLGVRVFDGYEGSGSSSNGSNKRQTLPFDCVEVFNFYARLRPAECRGPDEPLYLCPDPSWDRGGPWFKPGVAGTQLLSRIPRLLGMKPPRDQPPLPPPPPITELPPTSLYPSSLTQLRENLLASMNSFIAEKIGRTENVAVRELPPPPPPPPPPLPFLGPHGSLTPENLSILSKGIARFPQSSIEENEKIPGKGKTLQEWNSPVASSMDGSVEDTTASSPKSLPAPSVDSNALLLTPEQKPTLTP